MHKNENGIQAKALPSNTAPGEGEEPRVEGGVEEAVAARPVEVAAQGVVEQVLQLERGSRRVLRVESREGGGDGRHGERSGADASHPHLPLTTTLLAANHHVQYVRSKGCLLMTV